MSSFGNNEKLKNSIWAGIIFLILNLPATYNLTNNIFGSLTPISNFDGCPTTSGLILHSLVFIVIIRLMMDMN